jgi:hypothetical protein
MRKVGKASGSELSGIGNEDKTRLIQENKYLSTTPRFLRNPDSKKAPFLVL